MNIWTRQEAHEILQLLGGRSALNSALEKFCRAKAAESREMCAGAMQSVPRGFELASDYAAKAAAYDSFLLELEAALKKFEDGPTV